MQVNTKDLAKLYALRAALSHAVCLREADISEHAALSRLDEKIENNEERIESYSELRKSSKKNARSAKREYDSAKREYDKKIKSS